MFALRVGALVLGGSLAVLAAVEGTGRGDQVPLRVARSTATAPAATADALLVGDHRLRGSIDLSRAKLDGERYEVALPDGGRAVLTLDPKVQAAAEGVLEHAKAPYGAVVVMTVDGRLLALAGRANAEHRERDFELPLKVWAPAASIFKLVTAAALLHAGVQPTTRVCYTGGLRSVDPHHLTDTRGGECNDLAYGVSRSQNAILARLAADHLDPDALRDAAARFGFGGAPSFALAAEPGRAEIPGSDKLEFARVSAGFWHTEISPLGAAVLTNTVASGGLAVTPRIVAEVVAPDGTVRPVVAPGPQRVIDEDVADKVGVMMIDTVDRGTGFKGFHDRRGRRFMPEVKVAGKTGSLSRTSPSYLSYSWFVGFAPADDPRVVIAVLIANEELWHLKGHTAARMVLESVF